MFERTFNHRRYKVVSSDGLGVTLRVPKYEKTDIRIGTKKEAIEKGLKPKGSINFYKLPDGTIVEDGFLAKPALFNRIEVRVRGIAYISDMNWDKVQHEIDFLLNYEDEQPVDKI